MCLSTPLTFFILLLANCFMGSRCHQIGTGILSNVQFSRRSNAPIIRRLVGTDLSLRDCTVECGLRSSCSGLNYQRMLKMCELLSETWLWSDVETSKGWIYVGMDDSLRQDVLEEYCDNRDVCPAGQKCFREGDDFRCGIQECAGPDETPEGYAPNAGKVQHIGATVKMENADNSKYYLQCCADGIWAQDCNGNTATSTVTSAQSSTSSTSSTSLSTSTSTTASTSISTSATTSTASPISITIDEDDWYTLDSSTRKRQMVSVMSAALSWPDAIAVCKKNNGTLAHVNDDGELAQINDWLSKSPMEAQLWVGGKYDTVREEWHWESSNGAVKVVDTALWGAPMPMLGLGRQCITLFREGSYFLGNWNCDDALKFICERDFTDIRITDSDWFIVNSTRETREMAYIGNPTLSWRKAQEVCENNDATLAHVYLLGETEILQTLPISQDETLWVGAKYDSNEEKWYWWSHDSSSVVYVDTTLWAPGEPSNIDGGSEQCLQLSKGPFDLYNLGDNSCVEERGFLCQRKITVTIPEDVWFSLGADDTIVREMAYVDSPPLSWRQSKEICEMNGGTLTHIYSETEIKLLLSAFRANDIEPEDQMWTGGKFDTSTNEWVWLSGDVGTAIDLSQLPSGSFDSVAGECLMFSSTYRVSSGLCEAQRAFLCQRETVYTISENDWIPFNDRYIALVSQESSWEAAENVCKWNGGSLAYVVGRDEIDLVKTTLENRGLIVSGDLLWLGGQYNRDQNMWIWLVNSMPIEESLWLSGLSVSLSRDADDICIQMYQPPGNDMYFIQNDICTQAYRFLCQRV